MSDFLGQMAKLSEQRALASKADRRQRALNKPLLPLQPGGFDIIAEIKDRSPSEGGLAGHGRSRGEQAENYVKGGAAAISVLTEPSRFAGDLSHLEQVAAIAAEHGVPVMRKDFLVDPIQIVEARAAGASGVLLIVAMLSDTQLHNMLDCAWEYSLFVLLESFDSADLERTAALLKTQRHAHKAAENMLLTGVNTRNLRTLEVDAERLQKLAPLLPPQTVCVAESGLHDAADAAGVASLGYRMALVGTALMSSDDPAQLVSEMLLAGRAA